MTKDNDNLQDRIAELERENEAFQQVKRFVNAMRGKDWRDDDLSHCRCLFAIGDIIDEALEDGQQ